MGAYIPINESPRRIHTTLQLYNSDFFVLCVRLQAQLLFFVTFFLKVFQFTFKRCASRFSRLAELHNGQNDEF